MFFDTRHAERQIKSKQETLFRWWVWCCFDALEILQKREYIQKLNEHQNESYLISFASNSYTEIHPGHPLWQEMKSITKDYRVEVCLRGVYVLWTGTDDSLRHFDAISISIKPYI